MPIASLALGIAAMMLMVAGILLTIVPVLGTLLSFAAPVAALVGVVLGGLAISRARREGSHSGTALAGVIVSSVAFLPALAAALTCGLCNACVSAGMMSSRDGGVLWMVDAGISKRWPANAPSVDDADAGLGPGLPPPPLDDDEMPDER